MHCMVVVAHVIYFKIFLAEMHSTSFVYMIQNLRVYKHNVTATAAAAATESSKKDANQHSNKICLNVLHHHTHEYHWHNVFVQRGGAARRRGETTIMRSVRAKMRWWRLNLYSLLCAVCFDCATTTLRWCRRFCAFFSSSACDPILITTTHQQ